MLAWACSAVAVEALLTCLSSFVLCMLLCMLCFYGLMAVFIILCFRNSLQRTMKGHECRPQRSACSLAHVASSMPRHSLTQRICRSFVAPAIGCSLNHLLHCVPYFSSNA